MPQRVRLSACEPLSIDLQHVSSRQGDREEGGQRNGRWRRGQLGAEEDQMLELRGP